jgi:hypothetical protein
MTLSFSFQLVRIQPPSSQYHKGPRSACCGRRPTSWQELPSGPALAPPHSSCLRRSGLSVRHVVVSPRQLKSLRRLPRCLLAVQRRLPTTLQIRAPLSEPDPTPKPSRTSSPPRSSMSMLVSDSLCLMCRVNYRYTPRTSPHRTTPHHTAPRHTTPPPSLVPRTACQVDPDTHADPIQPRT